MPEFNFSKIEDQKKFENLPEKEREEVVGVAQEEAAKMQAKVESGEVKDYKEAEKLSSESETKDIVLMPDEKQFLKNLRFSFALEYCDDKKRDDIKKREISPESLNKIMEFLSREVEKEIHGKNITCVKRESNIRALITAEFNLNFPMPKDKFKEKFRSFILGYLDFPGYSINLENLINDYGNGPKYSKFFEEIFKPEELKEIKEKFLDQQAYRIISEINRAYGTGGSLLKDYLELIRSGENRETSEIKNDYKKEGAEKTGKFILNRKERIINNGILKKLFLQELKNYTFGLKGMTLTKELLELPDDFITKDADILSAVRSGFISKIEHESQHFGYDTYWGDIMRTKEELHIPVEVFSEIALEAVIIHLDKGDFKSVAGIKADTEISPMLIQKYFGEKISQKDWKSVFVLNHYFTECQPLYQTNLAELRRTASDTNLKFQERQEAIDSLAALSQNGDFGVCQEFPMIIENRSKQKDVLDSKWGLDSVQEAAFYTLIRLDNPESNGALFKLLLNENVNDTVKYATLKKLSAEKSNFLNNDARYNYEDAKYNLRSWLQARRLKENKLDWRDMEFINEILKIPSTETRESSLQMLRPLESQEYYYDEEKNDSSVYDKYAGKSVYEFWQSYKNIPQNTFLQLVQFVNGDENLLNKFQILYASNKKETTKKDNLLYGIVNIQYCNYGVQDLVVDKLKEIDFGAKENIDKFSELFRQIVFLDKIDKIKESGKYDDNYEGDQYDAQEQEAQTNNQELPQEIIEIFSKKVGDLGELTSLLKEVATKKIQEILPSKEITAEKIEVIEKEWQSLEPIFTYLGRYPQLKEYIAEMTAQFDTAKNWENWRYDQKDKAVKNQIGHLSQEQLEVWKGNYFSEIGDIMIAESSSDKPLQIQNILRDAVVTHKHIFNPEQGQNKNEYIQKAVEGVYNKVNESPDKKDAIVGEAVDGLSAEARSVDAIVDFNNLPRIRQCMESIVPEKAEIEINKKVKDAIDFLSPYLSKELGEILSVNYEKIGDKKKINSEELITPEIRAELNKEIKEIEENYNKALGSDVWEKLNLDKNNLKNLGQFYQKRQELKAAIDLLRLNNLSNKLIATNKIVEKEGKKGGETITSVVDNLKKFFKDSPLLLDLKNVEFALKEKIDFGEKRRLAMILSDNPQMLWQAGKYPTGNGSCQHYAEGSHANRLMGYVGDANCKVSYLIDLNKLPVDIKKELDEKGFEEIKNKIPTKDLLNASLARSMVKMVKDRDNKPVVLIEPTYTVVYKGDVSMDKYYNIFIDLMLADPMKAKIARGGGSDEVTKGRSRSPEDQYEDLDLNSVKFIHKSSSPTKQEMEVMGRIRSSR